MDRRQMIRTMGGLGALAAVSPRAAAAEFTPPCAAAGRLRLSISRWCYAKIPLDDLCETAKQIGYRGIDLTDESDWPTITRHGLACSMANGFGTIPAGFNRVEQHDRLIADGEHLIKAAAAAGVPNIVCFSGNRAGLSDEEGIANCVTGLRRLAPVAERYGVTLCMELLNSKVDHPDYQADHTAFGVAVVRGVASPRVKLLYDIYHMQIMEGDVIRTIRDNAEHIAHFHTGGVPGRHEIDETQELNYRAVMQAIADLGFPGFVAQEFTPVRDPVASMRQAFEICNV